jgi:HEAT repeat protein
MDSVTASIVTGAVIAIISGFLTLVAFNSKEIWRFYKKWQLKTTLNAARDELEKAQTRGVSDQKIVQAVKDIALKSKEEDYFECFDWNDREHLVHLLGEKGQAFKGTEAVALALDFLKRTLKDEDVDVRIAAVSALGNICHTKTVPALIQALRDTSPFIRQQAATTLSKLHIDTKYVDPLIRALQDDDPSVRRAAAETLGKIKDKKATNYLVRTLKDYEWYVKREAAQALGEIEDPTAIPYLIRSAREEDADVRAAALTALTPFGEPANQELFDARVVEVFLEAKEDEDDVVQDATPAFQNFEKAVLILGSATKDQIAVFAMVQRQLHALGYMPIHLDLAKPNWSQEKAALAVARIVRFVIVDFTVGGLSIQLIRDIVSKTDDIPLVPVRQIGGIIPSTLSQMKAEHNCILNVYVYKDADDLFNALRERVIEPAEAKIEEISVNRPPRSYALR